MTNAELAILSLIAENPRHGYEIEQVIEERGMRDWTDIGFSSIYYTLSKLEKKGLVMASSQQQVGKGPARKVNTITENGRSTWYEATLTALSAPQNRHTSFQLGLANLPGLDGETAVSALQQYQQVLTQQLTAVQNKRQAQGGDALPFYVQAMFDLSLHLLRAELEWITQFIETYPHTSGENA